MAKITKNEIIEQGILTEHISQLEKVLVLNKEIDAQLKKTAKTRKSAVSGVDPNTADGIKKVNAEVKNSILLKKASIDNRKKEQQLRREEIRTNELIANQTRKAIALKKKEDLAEQKRLKTVRESNSAYKRQSKELADLSRRFKDLSIAGRGSGKVARGLLVDIKKLNAGLVKADAATGRFGRNVGNYPKTLGKATAGLKQFAGALGLTSGIFLLVQGLKDSIATIANFEQANANLASILGTTKDLISDLTEDAKRLGEISIFTASQITELQTELAKLGFNRKEILDSTEAIQQLAAATGTDLAQAATQVGSALRIFNLDASEAGRVTDVLAKATSSSALDMNKLATALPIVGSTAKVAGLDIEKTTALLGVLSDRGIDASTSGTSLRNIFLSLSENGLTWQEAMDKITNSTDKNLTALKLFGKRGATAAIILSENAVAADTLTEALENSGGAAEKMADTQIDTLSGAIKLLKSAWEGVVLSFADGTGVLGGLKDTIKFVAENLKTIVSVVGLVIKSFVVYKTVTIAMAAATKAYIFIQKIATKGMKAFNTASKANIIGAIAVALLLAYEAFQKFNAQLTTAEKTTKNLNDVNKTAEKSILKQQNEIKVLTGIVNDENRSLEDKQKAIDKLNEISPEYLGNLTLENIATEEGVRALTAYNDQLLETARTKAILNKIDELTAQKLDEQNASLDEQVGLWDKLTTTISSAASGDLLISNQIDNLTDKAIGNREKDIKSLDEQIASLLEQLNEGSDIDDILNGGSSGGAGGSSGNGGSRTTKTNKSTAADKEELRLTKIRRQKVIDEKKRLADENKDYNDFLNKREKLENEYLDKKLTDQEVEENTVRDKYFTLIELAKKYNEDTALLEEAREKELQDIKDKANKEAKDAQDAADKEAEEKRQQQIKDSLATTLEAVKIATDRIAQNIQDNIDKSQIKIGESESAVDKLQARADEGFVDAEQSIKAEKQKIANEKANIEKLEKRKKDLLIVVAGLELLSQKINGGDTNATSNAGSEISGFLNSLEGFYEGTDGTLGDDLSHAYAIQGDKDTHVIKAHKDERIMGVERSRKLKGLSQDEIVDGALMLKNGDFVGNRVVATMNNNDMFNDVRMISALNDVKKAVNNIKIPEHNFNYNAVTKIATESIRVGNKTINNHSKVKGMY